MPTVSECQKWHEQSYESGGFSAQRRYPNEELLRFFGRNYFRIPQVKRGDIRVLELGCGSGANLWMVAREGFDAHGIDFSESAIGLADRMQGHWWVKFKARHGDMAAIDAPDKSFDVVYDVFSAYCLSTRDFRKCLDEVRRVLKPGGRFFSYYPSKGSQMFREADHAQMLDDSTLNGVPDGGPFSGNTYPFRFIDTLEYKRELEQRGFMVPYLEKVGRTYGGTNNYFEFVVIEGERC